MPQSRFVRKDGGEAVAVGLFVACCLAALAGAVDACGLSVLHDLYISFMSGNTTPMGTALAGGQWGRALLIAALIAAFVAGAASGTVLAGISGRGRLAIVLAVVAAIPAVACVVPHGSVPAMPFAMGMLNAAIQQAGPVSVSVTYVTGTLVRLGRGLGMALLGQAGRQGLASAGGALDRLAGGCHGGDPWPVTLRTVDVAGASACGRGAVGNDLGVAGVTSRCAGRKQESGLCPNLALGVSSTPAAHPAAHRPELPTPPQTQTAPPETSPAGHAW